MGSGSFSVEIGTVSSTLFTKLFSLFYLKRRTDDRFMDCILANRSTLLELANLDSGTRLAFCFLFCFFKINFSAKFIMFR